MKNIARICFLIQILILVFTSFNFAQNQLPTRQMSQARLLFDNQEYQKALFIYYKLYDEHSDYPLLNFRIAESYYELINYKAAQKYLDNVKQFHDNLYNIPDFFLLSGKLNHRMNQVEQAVNDYIIYDSLANPETKSNVHILIKQAENAQSLLKKPLAFVYRNIGRNINSEFSELSPVINYDNTILYFTTKAKINDNQKISDATREYNESILFSERESDGSWSIAKPIEAIFAIDSAFTLHSFLPDFSAAILSRPSLRENDKGNIYISNFSDNKFNFPERFEDPINTFAMETEAFQTMNNMFFITDNERISKRPNVIASSRKSGSGWRKPGTIRGLSTKHSIDYLYVHPGEKFVVFASNCDKSMGGYDLFISINNNGKWTRPVNAGYPLNSTANEIGFSISYDGQTAFVASDRNDGFGRYDIYEFKLGNYFYDKFGININTVKISGKVKDNEGNPIECRIDIRSDDGNRYRINTDPNGKYFVLLYAGEEYSIDIRAKGLERYAESLKLENEITGQKMNKDFILEIKE